MIITLLVGFVVGMYFAQANGFIGQMSQKIGLELEEETASLFSLALVLAAAALVLSLLGLHAYPVVLCLGAAIGIARKPLLARITGNK